MVKFYVIQIKLHKMTLDDVPERWRAQVAEPIEYTFKELEDKLIK